MKNELQKKISKDLNIVKFLKESDNEFNQRLIYSAASMWVKSLIHGNSANDIRQGKEINYPDIMYVQSHLKKVIKVFIKTLTLNLDWIEYQYSCVDEIAMDFAGVVIQEMIYTNNIAEINNRKMAMVPHNYYCYGNWYQLRGGMNFSDELISLGVSQWTQSVRSENTIEEHKVIDVKGYKYYDLMLRNFVWKKSSLKSNYFIFKEGSTRAYSKCWVPYISEKVKNGIHIVKEVSEYNGGYVLVKHDDENTQMATLDPWYIKSYEIYRILYALNFKYGTRAQFRVKDKGEYKILYFASALPVYENRIILSISWPYRDYADKYVRVIPTNIWSVAEQLLSDLGVEIIMI